MKIRLPLPPPELSPNARVHWAKRAKAVKKYRETCGWSAEAQVTRDEMEIHAVLPAVVTITFFHDDFRRRDWDNLLASFKAGLDGLVDSGVLTGDSTSHIASLTLATAYGDPCVMVEVT